MDPALLTVNLLWVFGAPVNLWEKQLLSLLPQMKHSDKLLQKALYKLQCKLCHYLWILWILHPYLSTPGTESFCLWEAGCRSDRNSQISSCRDSMLQKPGYQGNQTTCNHEISAPNPRKEKMIEQKIILLFFFFTYTYMHAHTVTPMSVQVSCLWHYNWTPKQLFCTHVMQEITNVLFWIFPYTPDNDCPHFTGDCAPPRGQSTLFMPHCRQQNWSM